ncbi:hypothetical protein BGZ83_011580 [Gryganskiella cystojenkinii]|nr:hypothetical protein BGZ83_011580 [Gryganskiella cystojenkinii]
MVALPRTTIASPISITQNNHNTNGIAPSSTLTTTRTPAPPLRYVNIDVASADPIPTDPLPLTVEKRLLNDLPLPPFVSLSAPSTNSSSGANDTTGLIGGGSGGGDINDDGPVILDVGQKVVVRTQNVVLGVLFIVLGLVQVFYGFKFIRLTLFLMGFVSCAIIPILIMTRLNWQLTYFLFKPSHYAFWVWLLCALIGGVICFRFWDLGITFAGAFGGFALAVAIVGATDRQLSSVWRYVLLVVLVLLGAALATLHERVAVILCTSLGGAYMFMFGVDMFTQVGYREMIIIFNLIGKSLTYHPDRKVFIMIGCSFALAALGIIWECWHHETPILMDRKALFRIYGRPFGKRPATKDQNQDGKNGLDVLNQPMDDDFVVIEAPTEDASTPTSSAVENTAIANTTSTVSASKLESDSNSRSGSGHSSRTASIQEEHDDDKSEMKVGSVAKDESPHVQVLIEETDYQVGDIVGAPVVLGTHTESATVASSPMTTDTDASANLVSTNSNHSIESSIQRQDHHQHHSSSATATTTSRTFKISTSSSSSASTAVEPHPRPSTCVVQGEHYHSTTTASYTTSSSTTQSIAHTSSSTSAAETQSTSGTTTAIVDSPTAPF